MRQPANAKRIRPNRPEYGIFPHQTAGMLTWDWASRQMETARNYWLCTSRPNGHPHAAPVWGLWLDGAWLFGTDRDSVKARNIEHSPHAVVHLESGDETVIFEGILVEVRESAELKAKIDRAYAQKYPPYDPAAETDTDRAIRYRLVPHKVMAWLESDYPRTVTCWLFDVRGLN